MFDIHYVPQNWGIMRHIFGIPSYSLMVGLGIIAGLVYYFTDAAKRGAEGEKVVIIVSAALLFGMIGAKLPLLLMNYKFIGRPDIWLEGKTIVGGFIGGTFGVILIKKLLKIQLKMGNVIAPAVALGMSIGRLGCFLNGCCYGIPWSWGVDFGDGVLRLPTQLFESAFHLIAFIVLVHFKCKVTTPGLLFKYYISGYLVFRFFSEFFRENEMLWGVLTLYQVLSIIGLVLINFNTFKQIIKKGVYRVRAKGC